MLIQILRMLCCGKAIALQKGSETERFQEFLQPWQGSGILNIKILKIRNTNHHNHLKSGMIIVQNTNRKFGLY